MGDARSEAGEPPRERLAARARTEGARKWLRELTSIVLGVLIALALGEVADAIRWQVRVRQATAAMRQESAGNRFNVVERRLYAPCIRHRLAEIDTILRAAWRTGRLPPIVAVGAPGKRLVETAAYDMAIAEGIPMHMDRGDARDVAILYTLATRLWTEKSQAEEDLWATLSMLNQPGGPVDSNVLATLTQARAQAVSAAADLTLLAKEADRTMVKLHVPVEWGPYQNMAGVLRHVRSRPICRPLAPA